MSHSKRMIKRHLRDQLSKSFGSRIDPEKSEQLRRTKTDIENNLTRILKLIKSEDQSKKDESPRKEKELVGLVEDFYDQYQSVYGRLTREHVKAVPHHRLERVCSVSSSSSDSEYFSSEEFDTNTELIDSNKRQRSSFSSTLEALRTQAATEGKLTAQTKELEGLNQQKRTLELQVESQAHEVTQLGTKNAELHTRVLELELMLKESRGAVSVLQAKLKNSEEQAMSKVADLVARISKLEQEAKSFRTQKGRMEEKLKHNRNEELSQKKDLTGQLNAMQQNLNSICNRHKELEAHLEIEREKVSQHLVQIESLEENLAETTSVKQCLLKENECFLARIKDLELELESRRSKQHDLEKKLRDTRCEINRVADEGKAVSGRNHELERAMAQREEEICAILRGQESGASTQANALTSEVEDLRLELQTLQEQKSKLELQNEQSQKECSERLAKMESLNFKLETRVADQEETIKKLTETIDQIHAENRQARIWSKKFKSYQQFTERKIVELAEEFRRKMEDNIRLLHQRIRVAEQLNNENKDNHKMTMQRYEQENKILGEKIASFEDEIKAHKASPKEVNLNGLGFDVLNLACGKLEEHREYVLSLVSKMMSEVKVAKDWIKKRNGEMKQLKDKVDHLTALLSHKEEQERLLREKVWELEANVSKEGGQKMNLMREMTQLERKVGKLEKNLKEKDEELIGLGEKKREAIRQLCFLIEFHRDRCDYLKDLMIKTRLLNRN